MIHPALEFIDLQLCIPGLRALALDVHRLDPNVWLNYPDCPLSPQRRNQALRYFHTADRQRSIGATLILDRLLQPYGLREIDMNYVKGPHGKPYFAAFPDLHFNLSHSGNYALGVLADFPVGADVQEITDYQEVVARLCLHNDEISVLNTLPPSLRATAFTTAWCAKEALLKATGTGITDGHFPRLDLTGPLPHIVDPQYAQFHLHLFRIYNCQGAIAYATQY